MDFRDLPPEEVEKLRHAMFLPCESKEELANWVQVYLDLDFPSVAVDPDSNSSPIDLMWEMYDAMRSNNRPDLSRVMAYASRDSFKTLAAAILEVLCVVHLDRSVGHMAAIESQAKNSQRYVKRCFQRPLLREYVIGDNETKVEVCRYEDPTTKTNLTKKQFEALPEATQRKYVQHNHTIEIVICSVRGANSLHVPFFCVTGETELVTEAKDGSKRHSTARAVFRTMMGQSSRGRNGLETEIELSDPVIRPRVMSFNWDSGKFEFREITRAHRVFAHTVKVQLEDGTSIECTPEHPLYVYGEGFLEAKELRPGMEVAKVLGRPRGKEQTDLESDLWDQVVTHLVQYRIGEICRDSPDENPYLQVHLPEDADYEFHRWLRSKISEKVRVRKSALEWWTGKSPLLEKFASIPTYPDRPLDSIRDLYEGQPEEYPSDQFRRVEVSEITDVGHQWVYDFTVQGNYNFLANDILNKNCVDEVDIAPAGPYEESKFIPTEYQGKMPLTLLISTRKSRVGLVQKELDEAHKTGLAVRHWNIIDVTQPCAPERHLPNEQKTILYVSDDHLEHATEEVWKGWTPDRKAKFVPMPAFAGCVKCPIFFACKGNLATRQTSNNALLKSIPYTIGKFKEANPSYAKAQLLCRKPDTEGLIYPYYDPEIHMVSAAEMAEMITGESYDPDFSKLQLIRVAQERDLPFYCGIDHGSTHNFVAVSGIKNGNSMYIFDCQSAPELELEEKITLLNSTIAAWDPEIYPDPEDPSSNKSIRKAGFRVHKWNKEKHSVIGGINLIRSMLRPTIGKPRVYILRGDPGCETLSNNLGKYHWKRDSAGRPTNIPNDINDDECDATRYLILNAFPMKGKGVGSRESSSKPLPPVYDTPTTENFLQHFIEEALYEGGGPIGPAPEHLKGRKGKIKYDLS
jgi:hypothetical protein